MENSMPSLDEVTDLERMDTPATYKPSQFVALAQQIIDSILSPLVNPDRPCVLLDYPNHWNVGDHAIWLGEIAWLRRKGVRTSYVCSNDQRWDLKQLNQRIAGGTILLHGGGNFGDLSARCQWFREHITVSFPNVRIVQLPQTIHFRDASNLERAKEIINAHPDFHLVVRDKRSLSFAREHFRVPSYLSPDMAFYLGNIRPTWTLNPSKYIWLARTDNEAGDGLNEPPIEKFKQIDWVKPGRLLSSEIFGRFDRYASRYPSVADQIFTAKARLMEYLSRREVRRGVRLLSQGNEVITDRLHGHIISILLGKRQYLADNNYGKVSSFYETWTNQCDSVSWWNVRQ